MTNQQHSSIDKWKQMFHQYPLEALDALLLRKAYLGKWNRNETMDTLYHIFNVDEEACKLLDKTFLQWFKNNWKHPPQTIPAVRWSHILINAFSAVNQLNLTDSIQWLFNSLSKLRLRLRSLYFGPSRDPEADLLRTLALHQKNRDLQKLWIKLCRMEENLPIHYASLGIIGLRKLPEIDGKAAGGLNPTLFEAIVDLANSVNHHIKDKKAGKTFWLRECRALFTLYPRSQEYLTENFYPLLYQNINSVAALWLSDMLPQLKKKLHKLSLISKQNVKSFGNPIENFSRLWRLFAPPQQGSVNAADQRIEKSPEHKKTCPENQHSASKHEQANKHVAKKNWITLYYKFLQIFSQK